MGLCFIDFEADGQNLTKTSPGIVAEGANNLRARFALSPEWDGLTVYARFKRGSEVYDDPLEDGVARVPVEINKAVGWEVSLWGESGGEILTTRALFVDAARTIDLDGMTPLDPTESLTEQFFNAATAAQEAAERAAADAAEAAQDAANAADSAETAENIVGVMEGGMVHAEDAAAVPLARFSVYGKADQDGTPTPEAPAIIETVAAAELHVAGMNLFPALPSATKNGVTFTANADGSVTASGTSTANYTGTGIDAYKCPPGWRGKTFTVSGGVEGGDLYAQVGFCKEGGAFTYFIGRTFTVPADADYVVFSVTIPTAGTAVNKTVKPCLAYGDAAAEFEPHEEQAAAFDLQGRELAALPNGIRDELRAEGGRLVLHKAVGRLELDGTKALHHAQFSDAGVMLQYACGNVAEGVAYIGNGGGVLSDHFATRIDGNWATYDDTVSYGGTGGNERKFVQLSLSPEFASAHGIVDAATWNAWQRTSPGVVYYQLAEVQEIDLGAFDAPTVPAPVFNAWAAGDAAEVRGEWFTEAGRQVGVAQEWAARAALTGSGGGSVTAPAIVDNGDGTFTLQY